MAETRVRIADGSQDTQDRLQIFLRSNKREHPELKLRSLESAIIFAMDEAEKVPSLEKEIGELKKRNAELVGIIESEYGITKGDE